MKGLIVLDIDETLISSSVVKEDELKTVNQNNFDFNVNSFQWNRKGSENDATLLKVMSTLQQIKDLPDWKIFVIK